MQLKGIPLHSLLAASRSPYWQAPHRYNHTYVAFDGKPPLNRGDENVTPTTRCITEPRPQTP